MGSDPNEDELVARPNACSEGLTATSRLLDEDAPAAPVVQREDIFAGHFCVFVLHLEADRACDQLPLVVSQQSVGLPLESAILRNGSGAAAGRARTRRLKQLR